MDGSVTDAERDPLAAALAQLGMSEDDLVAKFGKWDKACDSHWSDWRKEAKETYDFYAGRQWDKVDEDALKEANRQPITINRTATIIDAVSGAEIMGRQEAAYFPREVGDSGANEVLTKGAEWVRDLTDADYEESEAVRDAFTCGMGWTETRMDYEEDPEGQILVERVDPLEMAADPAHRKPGCLDARYLRRKKPMAKEDFERLFPGKAATQSADEAHTRSIDRRRRYEDGDVETPDEDEVAVCEWQWFEPYAVALISHPETGEVVPVEAEEADALEAGGVKVVRLTQRRYWRAYTSGEQILRVEELPDGEFTYKAITGKRDRNKRTWFGLMRLMKDPQRFANSFFTQILHIIQTTTKGGIIAEDGAVEDIRKFEQSIAKTDVVTWVPQGVLSQGAIQPKPATPYPQGLDRLMEFAIAGIRDATGVNQELLGMVEREQAGVLEDQRKKAAYGILAPFFDSLRRYRRAQGRHLLKLMQKYLPDGTLVRIVGSDGLGRYVPLAKQPDTAKFDVIVDEAPAGPQQKERVWAMMQQMAPMLKEVGPEVWVELMSYSPFPTAVVQQFKQAMQKKAQQPPDPKMQAAQDAEIGQKQGQAARAQADARKANAEAADLEMENELTQRFVMSGGALVPDEYTIIGEDTGAAPGGPPLA